MASWQMKCFEQSFEGRGSERGSNGVEESSRELLHMGQRKIALCGKKGLKCLMVVAK